MSTHSYDKKSFLAESFPDEKDRAEVQEGAEHMVALSRATRLVEMRKRPGLSHAQVADRMHVRQERVSALERADIAATSAATKPGPCLGAARCPESGGAGRIYPRP